MEFDFRELADRDCYKLLISTVIPRPIAFVSTVDSEGLRNAAPFSFFNVMSYDPPVVALSIEVRPDGAPKTTAANIRATGEFVVNIVDEPLAEKMNVCAIDFGPKVDEFLEAGLTPLDSVRVTPPRIGESPVSMECRRLVTLEFGNARNMILGEVLYMHIRDDLVDAEKLYVDTVRLAPVARLNASAYARTSDRFEMPRIDLAD